MRKLVLVVGLALVGFACAEGVGSVLEDAGQMLEDAGNMLADAGTSMQDGSVPDAGAQQSKSVTCDQWLTLNGENWNGYALVDVGSTRFPDVTVRVTYTSLEVASGAEGNDIYGGWPPGQYVTESHGGQFIDGKLYVRCNGREESITVFY